MKPVKRRGNRRYYQQQDVLIVRQIRHLLYEQGYTISGARTKLSTPSVKDSARPSKQIVKQMVSELEDVLKILKS